MVHAGRLAGTLGWDPSVAVIIRIGQLAGDSVELRGEGSVGAAKMIVVSVQDGIKAQSRKGRALIFPGGGDGLDRIIECHSQRVVTDRKSTRLNSSHITISYAVFCLKKKNNK